MNTPDMPRPAVFLDRDGVVNGMVYDPEFGLIDSPQNTEQFRILEGVPEAIRMINELGLLAVIVSNQPGIAKGKCTPEIIDSVTEKMHGCLAEAGARLDGVYYCFHHPDALLPEYRVSCTCRKPKPGLLRAAARDLNIDLSASYMVGDGLTDILAGSAAGCQTIFLGQHKCDLCSLMDELHVKPTLCAPDLFAAVNLVRNRVLGVREQTLVPLQSQPAYSRRAFAAEATLNVRALGDDVVRVVLGTDDGTVG